MDFGFSGEIIFLMLLVLLVLGPRLVRQVGRFKGRNSSK
jgi:hypothetical protein